MVRWGMRSAGSCTSSQFNWDNSTALDRKEVNMDTLHNDARRRDQLLLLLAYEGRPQVLRVLSLTDAMLVDLLDGGTWSETVCAKFQRAWEPYEDLDTDMVVGAIVENDGDYVGDGGSPSLEVPEDVAPEEAASARGSATTVEDHERRKHLACLLLARLIMLAALYAQHLRPHEKLDAFGCLLQTESELHYLYGDILPDLYLRWDEQQSVRLAFQLAGERKRIHSGLRGFVNRILGRKRIKREERHRILTDIGRNRDSFIGMNSDPRVLTGAYLRWDWYRN